jgi:hypothetical protein
MRLSVSATAIVTAALVVACAGGYMGNSVSVNSPAQSQLGIDEPLSEEELQVLRSKFSSLAADLGCSLVEPSPSFWRSPLPPLAPGSGPAGVPRWRLSRRR